MPAILYSYTVALLLKIYLRGIVSIYACCPSIIFSISFYSRKCLDINDNS